jgi:hypothetical protein
MLQVQLAEQVRRNNQESQKQLNPKSGSEKTNEDHCQASILILIVKTVIFIRIGVLRVASYYGNRGKNID